MEESSDVVEQEMPAAVEYSTQEKKDLGQKNTLVQTSSSPAKSTPDLIFEDEDNKVFEDAIAGNSSNVPTSIPLENSMDIAEEEEEDSFEMEAGDLTSEYSPERVSPKPPAQASSKMKKTEPSMDHAGIEKMEMIPILYQGIVTDQNGIPLIGANINIKETDIHVTTDINGRAKFENVSNSNPRIVVSYLGYESVELPLKNNFNIQLQGGKSLSEVVVVAQDNSSVSKPNIGWDKFNDLVKSELDKINLSQKQKNEIVQVNFNVGSSGEPKDIEIIQGKDNPKASIIIKLIETSGKWSLGAGSYSY